VFKFEIENEERLKNDMSLILRHDELVNDLSKSFANKKLNSFINDGDLSPISQRTQTLVVTAEE
jgi:hypothetical protein